MDIELVCDKLSSITLNMLCLEASEKTTEEADLLIQQEG